MSTFRLTSLLLLLSATGLCAQNSAELLQQTERIRGLTETEQASTGETTVPEFYEGEMEDLGPQLLLLRKRVRKAWQLFLDFQTYHTTNVSLAELNETGSNVFVSTAELAYLIPEGKFEGWKVNSRFGVRYQVFRYGMWNGDDKSLGGGGAAVDVLDFNARSGFANMAFTRGNWRIGTSLTYTSLVEAHGTGGNFYYEWIPAWSLGRLFIINDKTSLYALYDGNWRTTETPANDNFGLDEDTADKTDHALGLILTRQLSQKWSLQPALRLQRSFYTAQARDRNDWIGTVSANLNYTIDAHFSIRAFTSYEIRESSEPATTDYENWNFGSGLSGVLKF